MYNILCILVHIIFRFFPRIVFQNYYMFQLIFKHARIFIKNPILDRTVLPFVRNH